MAIISQWVISTSRKHPRLSLPHKETNTVLYLIDWLLCLERTETGSRNNISRLVKPGTLNAIPCLVSWWGGACWQPRLLGFSFEASTLLSAHRPYLRAESTASFYSGGSVWSSCSVHCTCQVTPFPLDAIAPSDTDIATLSSEGQGECLLRTLDHRSPFFWVHSHFLDVLSWIRMWRQWTGRVA